MATTKTELRLEVERLEYWLLESYNTLTRRSDIDDGMSDDELLSALCSVLANRGIDPNEASGKRLYEEWKRKSTVEKYKR